MTLQKRWMWHQARPQCAYPLSSPWVTLAVSDTALVSVAVDRDLGSWEIAEEGFPCGTR